MKNKLKTIALTIIITAFTFVSGCDLVDVLLDEELILELEETSQTTMDDVESDGGLLDNIYEDEYYYDRDDVAAYIWLYKDLPDNYITKQEAEDMDWEVDDGSEFVIGGDYFGNYEGLLPEEDGRDYYEADLVEGYTTHRGTSRLVYSNDGLVFYTNDHYESFEQLYGED